MSGTSRSKGTLRDSEKDARGPLHVSLERTLKFDIFPGTIDKNAFWLERVEGLENAKRRMEEIATKRHERYFVFCDFSHTVVAQIDASPEIATEEKALRLSEVGKPEGISGAGCSKT
jgi:hypothetical protein